MDSSVRRQKHFQQEGKVLCKLLVQPAKKLFEKFLFHFWNNGPSWYQN